MDLQLRGRRALITGSTAGIGLAIAKHLAAEGAKVVIAGRRQSKLDAAVAEIRGVGPVRGILADAGRAEGSATLAREAPEIDILVNNLGIYESKDFAGITDADWHRVFEVNVASGARLAQAYLPDMRERG